MVEGGGVAIGTEPGEIPIVGIERRGLADVPVTEETDVVATGYTRHSDKYGSELHPAVGRGMVGEVNDDPPHGPAL